MEHKTLFFEDEKLNLIDQRILPLEIQYYTAETYEEVCEAIKKMVVRGAPAIGACGAYGYYLAVKQYIDEDEESFLEYISKAKEDLLATRPTAVNLSWSINKMEKQLKKDLKDKYDKERTLNDLLKMADNIAKEDIKTNKKIGQFGNELIDEDDNILTHCNAGALATVGYGTALGVIRAAYNSGKKIKVYMDETRPRLQGASLTAFEMKEENIPATLIVDSAAATLIRDKVIDKIVVGADRIAKNGDTANKIGTFMLSVLAKRYNVPFYIAAPVSTIDFSIDSGDQIEIEIREDKEVTEVRSVRVAPEGIDVYNPAFDITPAENISAIVTEKGIIKPPFIDNIKELKSN
ncbi:MAG: S-methyl-5-thioribose-1-phosphate isomerase [Halanaerobiales bacterium]|nr:S-methyl-5-thioribose-1-phosphate isomerase [Halanaerobiales bacterium]